MINDTPPHSIDAEIGLLACCMIGDDARERVLKAQANKLQPGAFYATEHRIIFEAMLALLESEQPIDEILILDRLKAQGHGDRIGWETLESITKRVQTPMNFSRYLRIVTGNWKLRKIIRQSRKITEIASTPGNTFDDVRELIQEPLTEISKLSIQEARISAKDEIGQLIEQKKLEFSGEAEEVPEELRVHIGMPINAEKMGFVDRSETDNYIVIGAPSSRGKSTFMRQIVNRNLLEHPDWKIAAFLMEGGRGKFWHALACQYARIPNRAHYEWVSSQRFDPEKKNAYFQHLDYLKEQEGKRIFVFEKDQSITEIEARCKELDASQGGLDLVIVDYIQAIQSGKTGVNREQQISFISTRLRTLQVSLGCPLITGSQLNKEGEARESAQIYNDSTRFWRIDRPKKDERGREQENGVKKVKRYFQTLEQTKYRNGQTGELKYIFNTECGIFYDMQDAQASDAPEPSNIENF